MPTHEAVSGGYRRLGLIADPFALSDEGSGDSAGVRFALRSASLRLLAAIDSAADDPAHLPIVVEKAALVPTSYFVTALAPVMGELSRGEDVPGILSAYVPLDMMRVGRVRSVLNVIAERTAGLSTDLTLGEWARTALVEPDVSLAQWQAVVDAGADAEALVAEIDADPAAFGRLVFGDPVGSREGAEDFETLMRVATTRQEQLDSDPAEGEEGMAEDEDNTEDALAEVFTTPLGDVDPEVLPEASQDGEREAAIRAYVIAYTGEHLSAVVARGIAAYCAQGTNSMAQELKITKAPTKTLLALLRLTSAHYRDAVFIYDRLEMWKNVPTDLRSKIVASLTQLRWALKDHATLVLLLVPGTAPELEESFSAARRISWSFEEVEAVWDAATPFDSGIVSGWISSAALDGELPAWAAALLDVVPEGTPLDRACAAMSYAFAEAISANRSEPDPAAVTAALEMEGSTA